MGFKKTSDTIAISFGAAELTANTFVQDEIQLQLDILNNEIFVVLAVDLDPSPPDAIAATDTATIASLTSTSQVGLSTLASSNCIAVARDSIQAAGFVDGGVSFSRAADQSYIGDVDYIALISTNNFFVQLQGAGNTRQKFVTGRLWGFRARADSNTYAALVQSEVLSA